MKAGAIDFLTKPVNEEHLLQAINAALMRDRESQHNRIELAKLEDRYASLTPREREVLPLAVSGSLNKQAATELGVSQGKEDWHHVSNYGRAVTAAHASIPMAPAASLAARGRCLLTSIGPRLGLEPAQCEPTCLE
jgi:FixJ family two-component response regulator